MIPFKPKKSLGQHFLHDKNIARKIVNSFQPQKEDCIIEIGPGVGMLTDLLKDKVKRIYLIEKDTRAVDHLNKRYKDNLNIIILHQDFLDLDFRQYASHEGKKLRVIGNIPYYITSPILFHIIDNRQWMSDSILMMQYEVARRINATPGTSDYGILSVQTQTWATTKFLFKVFPTVFSPPPSVDSAVIHIIFDRERKNIQDENFYRSFVRSVFGQRRKMLRSRLRNLFPQVDLQNHVKGIDLKKRPEDLSIEEFITLSNQLYEVTRRYD